MGKVGNTLLMLRLLETGRKYSVKELAQKIEVTPRMIKNYKNELEKTGIYIDTIRGQYGGYVYHKKHDYNVSFDYLDVSAIEKILDKLNKIERDKITITLEKIRSIVIYSADESRKIKIDKNDLEQKYLVISKAIKNANTLKFTFHNKIRNFIPYSFTYYKQYIYVTGYSTLENDIKTFNISGIKNMELVKNS